MGKFLLAQKENVWLGSSDISGSDLSMADAGRMHKMNKQLVWTTIKIKISELATWEKNPVKLSKADAEQIRISLEKFGQVMPLVANSPVNGRRRLIDGHQRRSVELAAKKWSPDTLVDVRVPSRILSSSECDELSLRLRRNRGDTDMRKLVTNFQFNDLLSFGFNEAELSAVDFRSPVLKEQEETIRPKEYLRILVSVPIRQAGKAKKYVEPLEKIDGIEIIYGAN
jgi:hypothetical protein